VIIDVPGTVKFAQGPLTIIKFMKLSPRGAYERYGELRYRDQTWIEVYTDPGGIRTLAAADIRFRDPGKNLQ
jgi:hypothetical protein